MIRLFLLYAILIFAKKAPKLISDLLKLDKDGNGIGLKGLNIKNKMGEAALVGDKVKKGMMGIQGGLGKIGGAGLEKIKDKLKEALLGGGSKLKGKAVDSAKKLKKWDPNKGIKDNMKSIAPNSIWTPEGRKAKKEALKNNLSKDNIKDKLSKGGSAVKKALMGDFKLNKGDFGNIKTAGNLKTALSNLKGNLSTTPIGKGLKTAKGLFLSGFEEYKDAENTKGAITSGRREVNPNYQTVSERFERNLSNAVENARIDAGLFDEREKGNIVSRSDAGLPVYDENGNFITSKPTVQDVYANYLPNAEQVPVLDGHGKPITDAEGNVKMVYKVSDEVWDDFSKGEYFKHLPPETQLSINKMRLDAKYEDLNSLKDANEQIPSLTSSISEAESKVTASIETEARQLMTDSTFYTSYVSNSPELVNMYNAIPIMEREHSRLEMQYNQGELSQDEYTLAKAKLDSEIMKTRENFNNMVVQKLTQDIMDSSEESGSNQKFIEIKNRNESQISAVEAMKEDLEARITERKRILDIGYNYKDKNKIERLVDSTNVLNALESTRDDITKNSEKLSKKKESFKPKPSSDGKK